MTKNTKQKRDLVQETIQYLNAVRKLLNLIEHRLELLGYKLEKLERGKK